MAEMERGLLHYPDAPVLSSNVEHAAGSTTVMLVDTNPEELGTYAVALASVADRVCAATDFQHAKSILLEERPDVVVTQVRLGEFNGLHLVLWGRTHVPGLRHVVIGCSDPTLESLARALGLFFIRNSDEQAVVQATLEVISRDRPRRRWSRTSVAALPARINGRPVDMLDVSYGGFSVEMDAPAQAGPEMNLAVEIPNVAMEVQATGRWMQPVATGRYRCGAHVDDGDSKAGSPWRAFVDGLSIRELQPAAARRSPA